MIVGSFDLNASCWYRLIFSAVGVFKASNSPKVITNLSIPSVIFADASWYGSLRGGVLLGGGGDGQLGDNGSRWGIKGSTELSDGLTAVYNFESKINPADATQPAGRHSYFGLSGGFGTLTFGQTWSAVVNHATGMRYLNPYHGSFDSAARPSDMVKYSFVTDAASFEADLIMDGGKDTGNSVDRFDFGATINLGDIGKLGLAYTNIEDSMKDSMMKGTPSMADKEAVVKATDNGLDYSGLVVRDKTTRKPINGEVASVSSTLTINKGTLGAKSMAVYLMQVYSKASAIPSSFDNVKKHTDGKFYASECVLSTGIDKDCATKTWAYVGTENVDAADGKVTSTHTVYVPSANDIANWSDTKLNTPEKTAPKMLTVVTVNNSEVGIAPYPALFIPNPDSSNWTGLMVGDKVSVLTYTSQDDDANPVTIYVHDTGDDDVSSTPVDESKAYYAEDGSSLNTHINDGEIAFTVVADGADTIIATYPTGELTDSQYSVALEDVSVTTEEAMYDNYEVSHVVTMNTKEMTYGETATHVALQLSLGALTGTLGYSEYDSNNPMKENNKKLSFLGLNGDIGDAGLSWTAFARNVEDHDGSESNPWGVSLSKSLGDGVTAYIDHADYDGGDGGETFIGMNVNF